MNNDDVVKSEQDRVFILLTGANSGLGFSTCCRLIDEFLDTRQSSQTLTLIITTRDFNKGNDAVSRLQKYLEKRASKSRNHKDVQRISIQPEQVDLTSLRSVRALSQKLAESIPRIDAIILNAGIGGFEGVNWPLAFWQMATDFISAVTYPKFKIASKGLLTAPQLSQDNQITTGTEEPLGKVFCANVFGHYCLAHNLASLLSCHKSQAPERGRIIWVGTVEASATYFNLEDIQAFQSSAYESSKRLIEILALTAALPSTNPWVDRFLAPPQNLTLSADGKDRTQRNFQETDVVRPSLYVAHPGICNTNILPIHPIMFFFQVLAVYMARLLGSVWHPITAYKGACAIVWLALTPQSQLDAIEEAEGAAKWGSSTDILGRDKVMRTEVDGWGFGGVVGEEVGKWERGRRKGAIDVTEEQRFEFEALGRRCWKEMEDLREYWEQMLG